jgi:hypothetical protein
MYRPAPAERHGHRRQALETEQDPPEGSPAPPTMGRTQTIDDALAAALPTLEDRQPTDAD